MSIAIFMDDDSLGHRPPEGHPERPARYEAAKRRLAEPDFAGIARLPTHGDTVEELMRAADSAMYEAKRRGKGQYRFAPD